MTFTVPQRANSARIQLDARCTVTDGGKTEEFVLITPCKSEIMYVPRDMWQIPNYDFCGIFSQREYTLLRTFAEHDPDRDKERQTGDNADNFAEVKIDLRYFDNTRQLTTDAEVAEATWQNLALVARTSIEDGESGLSAVIEYPIKTMNVRDTSPMFQVDTGPVLFPDLAANVERPIERFSLAFAVYNTFDYVEFMVRTVTALTVNALSGTEEGQSAMQVMHYSRPVPMAARHEIFCVEQG
jgi:hypothetical protein